ncbi:MAG: hypothetical protein MZV65_27880 [Chromatiales bacterium]|nr:hypothetical protein [Chromatiales bacterium]
MSARALKKAVTHDSDAEDGRDVSLQVMAPARVKREVSLRAAQEGTTQRTIILRALKAIGITVKDEELCDRRKMR